MTYPKPLLKASLYTAKSLSVVGKANIGTLVSLFLRSWNASLHCSLHLYLGTFLVKLVSGLAIFKKL